MGKFRFSTRRVNSSVAMPAFEDCGSARRLRRIPLQSLAGSMQGLTCACWFYPSCYGLTGNLVNPPLLRRRPEIRHADTSVEPQIGTQPLLSFMVLSGLVNKPCWYNRLPELRKRARKLEKPDAENGAKCEATLTEPRLSQSECKYGLPAKDVVSAPDHGVESAGLNLSQIEAACLIRRIIKGTPSPSQLQPSPAGGTLQVVLQEACPARGCHTSTGSWSLMTSSLAERVEGAGSPAQMDAMPQDAPLTCGAPEGAGTDDGAPNLLPKDATCPATQEAADYKNSPGKPQVFAVPRTPSSMYFRHSSTSPAIGSWDSCSPTGSFSHVACRSPLTEGMWCDADVGISGEPLAVQHDCSACGCHLEALRVATELPMGTPMKEAATPAGLPPALLVAQLLTLKEKLEACLSAELEPLVNALETVLRKARAVERIERASLRNGATGMNKTRATVNMSLRPELEAVFKQAAAAMPQLRAILEQGLREPLASVTPARALSATPTSAGLAWACVLPESGMVGKAGEAGSWLGGSPQHSGDARSESSVARTLAMSSPAGMWIRPFVATPEGISHGASEPQAAQERCPCVPGAVSSPPSLPSSSLSSSLVITPLVHGPAHGASAAALYSDIVSDDKSDALQGLGGETPRGQVLAQGLLCLGCGSRSFAGLGASQRRTAALASTLTEELMEEFESMTGKFSAEIAGLQRGAAWLQQKLDAARSDADVLRGELMAEQSRHLETQRLCEKQQVVIQQLQKQEMKEVLDTWSASHDHIRISEKGSTPVASDSPRFKLGVLSEMNGVPARHNSPSQKNGKSSPPVSLLRWPGFLSGKAKDGDKLPAASELR